jgi:hypothetical protein
MKIYILVRTTADAEFNNVDVFQGVYPSLEKAEKAMKEMNELFPLGDDDERSILEREV